MIDLSEATVTSIPDVPMERLVTYAFTRREDSKAFDLSLIEPKEREDFFELGWWIEYRTLTEKDGDVVSTEYVHIESLPHILMAALECWRMNIRKDIEDAHRGAQIRGILQPLIDAGIAEEVPDEALPEGVGAVMMKAKDAPTLPPSRDQSRWRNQGWRLVDVNSDMELPFGEIVRDSDGDEWELIGGYPPQVPGSTGRVFVNDQDGCEREFFPGIFDLKWIGASHP